MRKLILVGAIGFAGVVSTMTPSEAVVCAKGVARAGCAGPNGAVVARRPVARPVVVAPARPVVVAPKPRCAWVNGVRVCR
jgi:hypothetical protein